MGLKSLKFLGILFIFKIVWCRYTPSKVDVLSAISSIREVQTITNLSLDPNDVDNQKFLLRGMDPEAVKELLITKQPVIQNFTDNEGRNVKITYELTPSGSIRREKITDSPRSLSSPPNVFHLRSNWPTQTSVHRRTFFSDFDDQFKNFDSFTTTTTSTTTTKPDIKPITVIDLDELPGTSLTKDADGVTHRTYNPKPTPESLTPRNTFKYKLDSSPESDINRNTDNNINRRTFSTISTFNSNSDVPYEIIPTRNFGYNFGSYPETTLSKIPDINTPFRTYSSSPSFSINSRAPFPMPNLTKNLVTEETKKYMVLRHNDGIKLEANCTLNKIHSHSQPQSHISFRDSLASINGFSLPPSSEWNIHIIGETYTKTISDSDGSRSTETCTVTNIELLRRFSNYPVEETTTTASTVPTCVSPETTDNKDDNSIDGFLKKINISEEEIIADGGEYIKNIIEENGRILSIKLILSNVQGDNTKSANLNDPVDKKPIK